MSSFFHHQPLQHGCYPCPAKLNLFLYINGRLENGYHELQTLFQFIDYCDWLTITRTNETDINLDCDISNLALQDNLIYKAAKLLQQATQCNLGAKIKLEKNLPLGGGIGGGSSNAATTLIALNQLWDTQLTIPELMQLGLQLGADVPIFIYGKSAFAEGIGEKLTPCSPAQKWYLVLKPAVAVSTADIFNDPNLTRNTAKQSLNQLLKQQFSNDCQKVVVNHYSIIEETLNWLLKYAPARLTGTGACIFAEFEQPQAAYAVLKEKPKELFGFVAQGRNISPLHQALALFE